MEIPLTEPTRMQYIRIDPATNHIHLLVSFIEGEDISTANTCKVDERLKVFFSGDAVKELETYKSVLEFHCSLLEESNPLRQAKKERLNQINIYLEALLGMNTSYMNILNNFRSKPTNLYSIQLRPRVQDPYSKVVNPVFTINRGNDRQGTPSSSLYKKMHEAFPKLNLERTDLTTKVLNSLPENPTFEAIKHALKEQCTEQFKAGTITIDFDNYIEHTPGHENAKKPIDKAYVDGAMGFYDDTTTSGEYIDALLYLCAPNIWGLIPGSPFYLGTSYNETTTAERLSITTQFYLGVLNVHCRIKGISSQNFGKILDDSPELSQELVGVVSEALTLGNDVESAIVTFFNKHKKAFQLSRDLSTQDKDTIQQKFDITYRTITATKENEHMDDFLLLDKEAKGENAVFETRDGVIYMDFAHIAPTTGPNQTYFAGIRNEATQHPELTTSQNKPVITVDIEPATLIDKLNEVHWEMLPREIIDACSALPAFKVRQLLDYVAKGKQDEANARLQASDDTQTLLRTPGKFTDYSGRTFNCTAYEYAYWAKDTHMCRMLERHMDTDTKAVLLEKVNAIERSGLAYQQNGVSYQNPHYDMCFVLKDLNPDEFRQLKAIASQDNSKIQQATEDNYQSIPFTATEYEALKNTLEQHRPTGFFTSPANAIRDKLQFDFHSLITALDVYVTTYDKLNHHEQEMAWLAVGKAQRDVPAHVAQEYCRPDRSFDPLPKFNEETLPRTLTFHNQVKGVKSVWFPLTSSTSGLGFDFGLTRQNQQFPWGHCLRGIRSSAPWNGLCLRGKLDLAAVRCLDEVRLADLTQSRDNLRQPENRREISF